MTRLTLFTCTIILFFPPITYGQSCNDCRYVSPVFDSVKVTTVKFGQGPRANGNMQELYMDIYEPSGDTATNRPVAIFAFGGAYVTGGRDDWYVVLVCEHLARAGYVVASIDYRIYDDIGELAAEVASGLIFGVPYHMRIFFRPMQDMRAAVQYLKADFSELGNNYRIDTSRILLGGASSGGITALMVAYCDKESELAELGAGNISPIAALGGFNTTTGLYPNYSWNSLAVFQVSGALLNPAWIEPGDIPVISAHGDADNVVPYKAGAFAGITLGFFNMYGSYLVDSAARANNVCSYLYPMEGKDHPSESFGIEYIKSVVYRLMLRMHAVINERSFCCGLELNVSPTDTLRYRPGGAPATINAGISNSNGTERIQWCGIECKATGTATSITVEPDTSLKYIACLAYEGSCQDVALNMVKADSSYVSSTTIISSTNVVTVYPQPASGSFRLIVSFENSLNSLMNLEIFDLQGKTVLNKYFSVSDRLEENIAVHDLTDGSYILRLASNEWYQYRRISIIN